MRFLLLLLPLLLTACHGVQLEKLDGMGHTQATNPYHTALFGEYLILSQGEYDEGDYRDSDAFAIKAMASTHDGRVGPEPVSSRDIPSQYINELSTVNTALNTLLNEGGAQVAPIQMARAVSHYDCWLQEQEENIQADDIAKCRGVTLTAIDDVLATLNTPTAEAQTHIVFFRFNRADLTEGAPQIVEEVARMMNEQPAYTAYLYGHADAPGTQNYNQSLSERRVSMVAQTLKTYGIATNRIVSQAFGETKPMVDARKELKNRRVEIILSAE